MTTSKAGHLQSLSIKVSFAFLCYYKFLYYCKLYVKLRVKMENSTAALSSKLILN